MEHIRVPPYHPESKRCLNEKVEIAMHKENNLLNTVDDVNLFLNAATKTNTNRAI